VIYTILVEQGEGSFGAVCPDLPGVVAVGDSLEEVVQLMRDAIPAHIAGLVEDGLPVPEPSTVAVQVRVDAA
jgi:predicted RNase H-like HicB family nuclease